MHLAPVRAQTPPLQGLPAQDSAARARALERGFVRGARPAYGQPVGSGGAGCLPAPPVPAVAGMRWYSLVLNLPAPVHRTCVLSKLFQVFLMARRHPCSTTEKQAMFAVTEAWQHYYASEKHQRGVQRPGVTLNGLAGTGTPSAEPTASKIFCR